MRKVLIGTAMFLLVVAVLRRVGRPRWASGLMERCQEIFDRGMPERRGLPSELSAAPARR
jgi:hypothetical protein